MKFEENQKSLKTAALIFIDFQYLSINCYWFLCTIIDAIENLFNFTFLLVDFGKVLCSSANLKCFF